MRFPLVLVLGALTGFIALSYEILWYRAFSFVSLGSAATFGVLLGVYLLGIANGAVRARALCRAHPATGSPRHLAALAGFLLAGTVAGFGVIPALGALAPHVHWFAVLLLVLIPTTFFGATLPLLSHFGIAPDDRAGARLSYLYVANIAGSAAGSLVTGFVVLDALPLARACLLLALGGLALAAMLFAASGLSRRRLATSLVGIAAAAVGLSAASPRLFANLWERLQMKEHYRAGRRFAEVVENRAGVITVTRDGLVFGGGIYDGRLNVRLTGGDQNQVVRAYAVAALHPAPKRVLLIGLSAGSWARVISGLPGVEHLTAVEINRGYLDVIARHAEVAPLLGDPRVTIVIDDGRRWLARHPDERFDVIVMNTTFHYRALVTNLLSREFLTLARAHLAPGGLLWFNTTDSADCIHTAATLFPYALQYLGFVAVSDAPLVFDRDRFRRVLLDYRLDGAPLFDLSRPADVAELTRTLSIADQLHDRGYMLARTAGARLVTDDNMAPEWDPQVPRAASPWRVFDDE